MVWWPGAWNGGDSMGWGSGDEMEMLGMGQDGMGGMRMAGWGLGEWDGGKGGGGDGMG